MDIRCLVTLLTSTQESEATLTSWGSPQSLSHLPFTLVLVLRQIYLMFSITYLSIVIVCFSSSYCGGKSKIPVNGTESRGGGCSKLPSVLSALMVGDRSVELSSPHTPRLFVVLVLLHGRRTGVR